MREPHIQLLDPEGFAEAQTTKGGSMEIQSSLNEMKFSQDEMAELGGAFSEAEKEVIGLIVDGVQSLGGAKSIASIYGLLFVSRAPLSFYDISARLRISTGSLSQGLRYLKAAGAIKVVYVPGERRDYYVAEAHLGELTGRLVQGTIGLKLRGNQKRIREAAELIQACEADSANKKFLTERLAALERWNGSASGALPLLSNLLCAADSHAARAQSTQRSETDQTEDTPKHAYHHE